MPWNLLILPLAAGYLILEYSYFFTYRGKRLEKERLILEAVLYGAVLLAVTYLIRILVQSTPIGEKIIFSIYSSFPIRMPFLGTAAASVIIACLFLGLNLFFDKVDYSDREIEKSRDVIVMLSKISAEQTLPLAFTLTNRKVYVGIVLQVPIPSEFTHIRLIPIYSGYRDNNTLQMKLVKEYLSQHSADSGSVASEVIFPVSSIAIIQPYTEDIAQGLELSTALYDIQVEEEPSVLELGSGEKTGESSAQI